MQAVSCKRASVCDEGLGRLRGNQQGSERAQSSPGEAEGGDLGRAGLSCLKSGNWAGPTGLLPRCQPVSPQVQQCLQQFKVTEAQLRQIQASLLDSMEQALRGQASPVPAVRMLPAYVGSIPHGTGAWHSLRVVARPGEKFSGRGGSSLSLSPSLFLSSLTRLCKPWECFWEAVNLVSTVALSL